MSTTSTKITGIANIENSEQMVIFIDHEQGEAMIRFFTSTKLGAFSSYASAFIVDRDTGLSCITVERAKRVFMRSLCIMNEIFNDGEYWWFNTEYATTIRDTIIKILRGVGSGYNISSRYIWYVTTIYELAKRIHNNPESKDYCLRKYRIGRYGSTIREMCFWEVSPITAKTAAVFVLNDTEMTEPRDDDELDYDDDEMENPDPISTPFMNTLRLDEDDDE